MINEAAECGFQVQAAFENEFSLLKPGKDGKKVEPVDSRVYVETFAMDTGCEVLMAICDAQGLTLLVLLVSMKSPSGIVMQWQQLLSDYLLGESDC